MEIQKIKIKDWTYNLTPTVISEREITDLVRIGFTSQDHFIALKDDYVVYINGFWCVLSIPLKSCK